MQVRRPELVLAGAVLVSAPMVPGILDGGISPTAALVRFLGALVVSWAAGLLLVRVLGRYSEEVRRTEIIRAISESRPPDLPPPTGPTESSTEAGGGQEVPLQ